MGRVTGRLAAFSLLAALLTSCGEHLDDCQRHADGKLLPVRVRNHQGTTRGFWLFRSGQAYGETCLASVRGTFTLVQAYPGKRLIRYTAPAVRGKEDRKNACTSGTLTLLEPEDEDAIMTERAALEGRLSTCAALRRAGMTR